MNVCQRAFQFSTAKNLQYKSKRSNNKQWKREFSVLRQQLFTELIIIYRIIHIQIYSDYFCGMYCVSFTFSALTLLVGRQKGHLAFKKTEWWGAGVVVCLERGADLHVAQLMPLPLTVSCFSKIQIGFTFLVPAHLGSPGKGPLNGCVCVYCMSLEAEIFVDKSSSYCKLPITAKKQPHEKVQDSVTISAHLIVKV